MAQHGIGHAPEGEGIVYSGHKEEDIVETQEREFDVALVHRGGRKRLGVACFGALGDQGLGV